MNLPRVVGNGPTKSIPHMENGQGEVIGVRVACRVLRMLEYLWHLSHFLAKATPLASLASSILAHLFTAEVFFLLCELHKILHVLLELGLEPLMDECSAVN